MLLYGFSALFGLLIGSFLNVCIYRIPRKQSLSFPGSHCPHCKKPVKPYDNIPLLSYLILKGKCRHCGGGISLRYPLVELSSAVIFILALWKFHNLASALPYALFMDLFLVISLIDIDLKIIPNVLVFPGAAAAGILAAFSWLTVSPLESLIGFGLGLGLFLLISFLSLLVLGREGMGMGDVKLIALIGILVGWQGVLLTIMLASLMGSAAGLSLGKGRQEVIPFGPFLGLGASLTILFGETIIHQYLLLF